MKQKIVDYELCKELDELNFECDSHTGWWIIPFDETRKPIWVLDPSLFPFDPDDPFEWESIKAYLCWDLLMWAKKTRELRSKVSSLMIPNALESRFQPNLAINECWADDIAIKCRELFPQNALARAVREILKEKE